MQARSRALPVFLALLLCLGAMASAQPETIRKGMSTDDVRRVQGDPESIDSYENRGYEIWHYGLNFVKIGTGEEEGVLAWHNPTGTLRVQSRTIDSLSVPNDALRGPAEDAVQPAVPAEIPSSRVGEKTTFERLNRILGREASQPAAASRRTTEPSLDLILPPLEPGLERDLGGDTLLERRARESGPGLFTGDEAPGTTIETLTLPGGETVTDTSRRTGGVTTRRYEGANGESVGGVRVETGDGATEMLFDSEGRSATTVRREAGDRFVLERTDTSEGESAVGTGVRAGDTTLESWRSGDEQVRRRVQQAGDATLERFERSDGSVVESRTQQAGDTTLRTYEETRDGSPAGSTTGFTTRAGDAEMDVFTDEQGASAGTLRRESGGALFEQSTGSGGETVSRMTRRAGPIVIRTYTDSEGNVYTSTETAPRREEE